MLDSFSQSAAAEPARAGVLYLAVAFGIWGFMPLFIRQLLHVPAMEILAHRVLWSLVFLGLVLTASGRWREIQAGLRSPRLLGLLAITTMLLAVNWLLFILAVNGGQSLQVSLGYYINPLVSVILGFVLLGERLTAVQWLAVAVAAAGVVGLAVDAGVVPYYGLGVAASFGIYGYVRKIAPIEAVTGLAIETALLAPFAAGYLIWLGAGDTGAFAAIYRRTDFFLIVSGLVTALPLIGFTAGARRVRLVTVGLMQYTAPSIQFVVALSLFDEPFSRGHAIAFGCIWTALALYSWNLLRERRSPP